MISLAAKQTALVFGFFLLAAWFGYSSGYDSAIGRSGGGAGGAYVTTLKPPPETTCWRMRPDGSWSLPWHRRDGACFSVDELR